MVQHYEVAREVVYTHQCYTFILFRVNFHKITINAYLIRLIFYPIQNFLIRYIYGIYIAYRCRALVKSCWWTHLWPFILIIPRQLIYVSVDTCILHLIGVKIIIWTVNQRIAGWFFGSFGNFTRSEVPWFNEFEANRKF